MNNESSNNPINPIHILQINSSLFGEGGQSSQLADRFVAAYKTRHANARVLTRDIATEEIPHLNSARFQALLAAAEQRTAEQQAVVDFSDALIGELQTADVIVLGLPLYNFGVPSQLKAYFDHIARAGVTFRYSANGPEGLLHGKKVYVFAARGGMYAGTALDTQTNYVRNFFAFIGIADVEFIYAEGLNMGDEKKAAALAHAHHAIEHLLDQHIAA